LELDLQRFYNINRRILMWIAFFAIVYLLHDFFAVMFLTFILGFVMRKVATFLVATTRSPYWAAVVLPYLLALTLLVLLMMTAIPRVVKEGAEFSREVPHLLDTVAEEIKKTAIYYGMGPILAKYVAEDSTAIEDKSATDAMPTTQGSGETISTKAMIRRFQNSPDTSVIFDSERRAEAHDSGRRRAIDADLWVAGYTIIRSS